MEFAKIWPLTCHNWVKYWPRTKNNTTNREYFGESNLLVFSAKLYDASFGNAKGGVAPTPPPPTPTKVAKHRLRARVKPLISDSATRRSLWPLECQPVALDDNKWQISKTLIQSSYYGFQTPWGPVFLSITSSDLAQWVPNFHTLHFSPSADIHQYGLLTKYQNLGYLSLTRNVKFRPFHLLVQWRLERRRLWRQ